MFGWSLFCFWGAGLLGAYTNIEGISSLTPRKRYTLWALTIVFLLVGTVLTVLQHRDQLSQQKEELVHRNKQDAKLADAAKSLADMKDKLVGVEGTLSNISVHDAALSDAMAKIASAARVPTDGPVAEIVHAIVEKLPKSTVTFKGNHNATVVGGGQAAQQQTVNAANGIGTIGGTLINPQVNNFGPPPAHLTYTEKLLTQNGNSRTFEVHIATDRSIPGAKIGLVFTKPFNNSDAFRQNHQPSVTNAPITSIQWWYNLQERSTGAPIPNSFAVQVNQPAVFLPGQDLVIQFESNVDAHVSQIAEIQ
jgi:hypothetical protein